MAATLHSIADESHEKILLEPSAVVMVESSLRILCDSNFQLDLYVADGRSKTMLTDEAVEKVVTALNEIESLF